VVRQSSLTREDRPASDPTGTRNSDLSDEHSALLDRRIVTNLNEVVQTGVGADSSISQSASVDAAEGSDSSPIAYLHAAALGDRAAQAFGVGVEVAEAFGSDDGSGADMDAFAQDGAFKEPSPGFELTALAQLNPPSDEAVGA
jgi:hypothetical protein